MKKLGDTITVEISGYELLTLIEYNEMQSTEAEAFDCIESSKWHDERIKSLQVIKQENYGDQKR